MAGVKADFTNVRVGNAWHACWDATKNLLDIAHEEQSWAHYRNARHAFYWIAGYYPEYEPIEKQCEWCGKSFKVHAGRIYQKRFCSRRCSAMPIGSARRADSKWWPAYMTLVENKGSWYSIPDLLRANRIEAQYESQIGGGSSAYQTTREVFIRMAKRLGIERRFELIKSGPGYRVLWRCTRPSKATIEEVRRGREWRAARANESSQEGR